MANKQNIYVGLEKDAREILSKINNCIVIYSMNEDGFEEILGYDVRSADLIRDEVSNMQGQLQLALKGLDKGSHRKEKYEEMLRHCDHFLEITKHKK